MSYNVARTISPSLAICSFSSVAAGNVDFVFINGDFTPLIDTSTITLESGFEYFVQSAPSISTATTYYHIIDDIAQSSYSVSVTSTTSGFDEQVSSIQADADVRFALYTNQAITSNSRLIIWRFPL